MKHMSRTYKKEDAMLRPEHESTLEKNQEKRRKRKEFMGKEYDKFLKSQLDPTLDK
jgi:hypothetical protein